MKKATRIFLEINPNGRLVSVLRKASLGALPNHCYQNSSSFVEKNGGDWIVVSGWLVGDFYGAAGTAIIPHYWLFNVKNSSRFDPTPRNSGDEQSYEYVEDFEIFELGSSECYLPPPLRIMANGLLQVRISSDSYRNLDEFDVAELYKLAKEKCQS